MNKYIGFTSVSISFVSLGFSIWLFFSTPKIAVMRSAIVIQKYEGMKEARRSFESKAGLWQANIDTLTFDFQREVNKFNSNYKKMSAAEKAEAQQSLSEQQKTLEQYKKAVYAKAKEAEEEYTAGALNQINSFIQEYAKVHGYSVVMGTTDAGNILYGADAIDITDAILEGLNKSYKTNDAK